MGLIKDKKSDERGFNVCTCYLHPNGASRYVSAQEFYDTLLTNIYEYQHLGKFLICGDFNSTQVSYRFLALGCFPANLVSDVVCVLFVLRVGSLKG